MDDNEFNINPNKETRTEENRDENLIDELLKRKSEIDEEQLLWEEVVEKLFGWCAVVWILGSWVFAFLLVFTNTWPRTGLFEGFFVVLFGTIGAKVFPWFAKHALWNVDEYFDKKRKSECVAWLNEQFHCGATLHVRDGVFLDVEWEDRTWLTNELYEAYSQFIERAYRKKS